MIQGDFLKHTNNSNEKDKNVREAKKVREKNAGKCKRAENEVFI